MGGQLRALGLENPLVLCSPSARTATEPTIRKGLDSKGIGYAFADFRGECTWKEIARVKGICVAGGHDAIVSCGGGKVLDTGRCAAARSALLVEKSPPELLPDLGAGVACVNVPTVISTDASTSSVSLVYTGEGVAEAALAFPTNPAMVLVDTAVVAKSPIRLLVAGMGDALATFFEADVSRRTATPCIQTLAQSTLSAQALARLCLETLLTYGLQAKAEAEAGVPGPAIEAVTEANVLLSGLGFESGGLSAAHAVGLAFHQIRQRFEVRPYHGELVAFGTLTQLILEGREPADLRKVFDFCGAIGLPVTFERMTLRNPTDKDLKTVADGASRHAIIRSMPGAGATPDCDGRLYDPVAIFDAMKTADAYGRNWHGM